MIEGLCLYETIDPRVMSVQGPCSLPSNILSEPTWPIKAKFYENPPLKREMKVYINGIGHMNKMAATPTHC